MAVTVPFTGVPDESGVTTARCPTAIWGRSVTSMSVVTSNEPGPMTTICASVAEADVVPETVCPVVRLTDATVPAMGVVSVALVSACWALLYCAVAVSTEA